MADRIIQRNDTAARWQSINPVLATGEIGIEIDGAKGYKIGDGKTAWNSLPYPANPTSVVQDIGNNENVVMSQKAVTEKLSELGSDVYKLSFINLSQIVTAGLTGLLKDGEWGYNKTTKLVYYKREGKTSLESYEMNSNILYKYNEELYKWNGTTLIPWNISILRNGIADNFGLSWDSIPSLDRVIGTTSLGSEGGGSHKIIQVKGGQEITIKGSPNGANYYVFVKSVDLFSTSYDLVDSITQRVTIAASSEKNIIVPEDAKYLMICHYYNESDRSPKAFVIDGYDLMIGAKAYITDLIKSAESGHKQKTKVVDLAETLTMWYYNTSVGVGGMATKIQSETLGTVLVRIKQGDIVATNSEIDSSGVRQWCIMKDDLTITKILPKFSEYTVSEQDVLDGGTIMAIPCRVTEQVASLYVRRTRIVVGDNTYNDKTIILMGDSQVGQCQGLEDVIEGEIGNRVINAGFGGCRWSWRTSNGSNAFDAFSAIGVADAMTNKDYTPLYSAYELLISQGETGRAYYKRALDALSSIDFGNGENIIVTIAYGGNDHSASTPLGEIDSANKETLYGAMNYVIDSLVRTFPMIDIRVLCPTYVAYTYEKDENNRKIVTEDSDVRKIGEYTRQEYAELLLEHAKRKKVSTYDLYNRGGRNKDNIYILTTDGIHPNTELGVKHTANKYLRILDSF